MPFLSSIIKSILALNVWPLIVNRLLQLSLIAGFVGLVSRAILVAEPPGPLLFSPLMTAAPAQASATIQIVSANLYHDFPRYRDITDRLEAFASLIEAQDVDILLLQEVARTTDLNVNDWLAARLGYAYIYARANGHREGIGFEEGLAIFSRYPLSDFETRQLSSTVNPFSRRVGLAATVSTPQGPLKLIAVHLGLAKGGNLQQLKSLQSWVKEFDPALPVVIGGDFNAENHTPRINDLRMQWVDTFESANPGVEPLSHVLKTPWGTTLRNHRLDYIFLKTSTSPIEILRTAHLETMDIAHSDHAVVLTEIAIKPGP